MQETPSFLFGTIPLAWDGKLKITWRSLQQTISLKEREQAITLTELYNEGRVTLNKPSSTFHAAITIFVPAGAAYQSAEVINLSRNIVITSDGFTEVQCDPTLSEVYQGFGTSTAGCMYTSSRDSCTMGLHTAHMTGGFTRIENVRVEKCGQRGIERK
jgi:hypothetical protein